MSSTSPKFSLKTTLVLTVLAFIIVAGNYVYDRIQSNFLNTSETHSKGDIADVSQSPNFVVQKHNQNATLPPPDAMELDELVSELVRRMQSQFADSIPHIATQVSLKTFRDDLKRAYPDHGAELFLRVLKTAFPEWVDKVLKAIALMDLYDEWLQGMLLSLNDMNPLQQQGTLWEKRRELFGEAATQIWQEEISAEQERQLTMNRTMEMLDRSYDTQMQERLYILQKTFEESYADKLQNMVVEPKGVLAQVFFGFDAVQKELSAMPAEARQAQINEIRKSMGFSEEQIKAQEASDQEREARWQTGYAYMAARKEAEAQFSGEELSLELDRVREKFFAHEATTIKREEEDLAFFRYTRPRVYGRN